MLTATEVLTRAAKSGDSGAFTELVRRYERAAWVVAWKVLQDHHAALDATQNAFVEAYCKLAQLRDPSQFGVWLMRIAHREALRLARRPVREVPMDSVGEVTEPAASFVESDHDALVSAVAGLPEHERLVVVLRYFNGHSMDEVAQLTGRPLGTVTKQLSRAIARLRTVYKVEDLDHIPRT